MAHRADDDASGAEARKGFITHMSESNTKIIGIDLGTTNSVVAVMEGERPTVIINSTGNRTTPSVVGFTDKGDRLVGQAARHQQVTNPSNTVFSIKRFMGRRHNEVQHEEKLVPYEVVGGGEDLVSVKVRDKEFTPPEVSAMILRDLKKTAEEYLGESVDRAVITVPAYFNDAQRQATKDAGEIAGLKVERIINEPTAAALAYGLEKKKNARIAVFDLGGGTFDVSILDVGDGVFEVLSSNGDGHLGGDDFDQRLIDFIADEFKKAEGIDIRSDAMALQTAQGSRREVQDRAVPADGGPGQPPVHHRRPERAQAPAGHRHPRHLRVHLRAISSTDFAGPCEQALDRRQDQARGHRGGRDGRRIHPDPAGPGESPRTSSRRPSSTDPSTPMKSSRSAPRSRAASCTATSRTCSSSTSPRCPSASRPSAAS